MTNEEVIRMTQGLMTDFKCESKTMVDFFNTIIKALDQELYEDAISRQAVIDAFWKLDVELRPNAIDAILNMVNDIPSVNPQERIGHWITTRTFMHDGEYYCDKCKCDAPNNEKWDYCPNCGCRMVKPQESEDEE